MKIAIAGAGVGGLSAAIFLRQAGFDVDVYEQAPELSAVGAGLRLSPNGLGLLRRAGLGPDLELVGVRPEVAWELRRWHSGETIWRGQFDTLDDEARHLLIHRADLLDVLLGHLAGPGPFLGRRLIHLEPGDVSAGIRARLEFGDGPPAEADVVIGADGIHSLVCDRFMPSQPPTPSGHAAFRATVPIEETTFFGAPAAGMVWMGPGKHFVAYPVSSGRLMNIIGVVPASARDEESWSADGDRDELLAAFAGWDKAVLGMISQAAELKRWALMHRVPLTRWTSGPVAVLGDAAHPMLPHLAQGACQAIEDAACLTSVLSGISAPADVPAALARYEEFRRPRASRIQVMSQSTGESYHLPDGPAQQARDARLAAEGMPAQQWIYDHDAAAVS
jgi:salicylate hydroxylase